MANRLLRRVRDFAEVRGEGYIDGATASDEALEGRMGLREAVGQLAAAAQQVAGAGSEENVEEARKVLDDARKALYRILAE